MSDTITDILPPTKAPRSISVGKLAPGTLKRTEPATIPPGDFADLVEQARQILINRSAYGTKSLRDIIVERLGVDMDTAYQLIDAIAVEAPRDNAIVPANATVIETRPTEGLLVNQYHRNAVASIAQGTCWVVLAGLELLNLKKAHKRGGWEDWIAENCEFNIRTAQRYMGLAQGIKAKALKTTPVSFLELLSTAPSELAPDQTAELVKTVQNLTDGNTVKELYLEFGIIKKPKSIKAAPPNGDNETDSPAKAAKDILDPIIKDIALHITVKKTWGALIAGTDEDDPNYVANLRTILKSALDALPAEIGQ